MSKFSSTVVTVTLDDAPGGTPRIITPYVNTIGGLKIENLTQQTNPFGSSNESHTPTGMSKTPDIPISGFHDDTATLGSHVIFKPAAGDKSPASVGRVLVILAATGATFKITVHLVSYEVLNKNGALTEYVAVLRQKSAGVWS
jgi:hypothetical protein